MNPLKKKICDENLWIIRNEVLQITYFFILKDVPSKLEL